jgi:hypothetical protein
MSLQRRVRVSSISTKRRSILAISGISAFMGVCCLGSVQFWTCHTCPTVKTEVKQRTRLFWGVGDKMLEVLRDLAIITGKAAPF